VKITFSVNDFYSSYIAATNANKLMRWPQQISCSLFKTAFTKEIQMQATFNTVTATPTISSTSAAADTAQVVVLHDKGAVAAQGSKSMRQHFEQLAAERMAWQDNAFRTSNEQLYVILQKCYQTYQAMGGDSVEAIALRDGFKDYINTTGMTFKKSTHTIAKIVQCVFGQDRRRISAYSIVLRTALERKVGVFDFPAFVRDEGGVEQVRLAKSPNALTVGQKAAIATGAVVSKSLGVFASTQIGQMMDSGKVGTNMVLVGTWQADGSVIVRAVVESDGVLNAALASYYSAIKVEVKAAAVEKAAANDASLKQEAIAQAVAAVVVNA
jgi:hypothetical protein